LDADYALALQLQAELNAELEADQIRSQPINPTEKVRVVSYYSSGGTYTQLDENLDEIDEDSIDSYDDDYEERYNNPFAPTSYTGSPSKPHHQNSKLSGRTIITKHDSTISKLENAQKLESLQSNAGNMMGLNG